MREKIKKSAKMLTLIGLVMLAITITGCVGKSNSNSTNFGPIHNINKGTNYTSIQSAINDASAGDQIRVESVIYTENINVTKEHLTLQGIDTGKGKPVIDTRGQGSAITLSAGWTKLEGFTMLNSNASAQPNPQDVGISIISDNNTVTNNNISSDNLGGIFLNSAHNNRIVNNNAGHSKCSCVRISLSSSNGNTLINNNVSDTWYLGITLLGSNNNRLIGNNASNNNRFFATGIELRSSDNNILADNDASNSGDRNIEIDNSQGNTLINNNISTDFSDMYTGLIGLEIVSSNNNIMINNAAYGHGMYGISFYASADNALINNNISNNRLGQINIDNKTIDTIVIGDANISHNEVYWRW